MYVNTSQPQRMAPNFALGKIYCIRNKAESDRIVYVGSTVRTLGERMSEHRKTSKMHPDWKLYTLMNRDGIVNFHIELLEDFPCERREQLHAREGHFIRLHNTYKVGGNMGIAGRSQREYQAEYKVQILKQKKVYSRSEEVKEARKAYDASHRLEHNARQKEYRHRKQAEREAQVQTPAEVPA